MGTKTDRHALTTTLFNGRITNEADPSTDNAEPANFSGERSMNRKPQITETLYMARRTLTTAAAAATAIMLATTASAHFPEECRDVAIEWAKSSLDHEGWHGPAVRNSDLEQAERCLTQGLVGWENDCKDIIDRLEYGTFDDDLRSRSQIEIQIYQLEAKYAHDRNHLARLILCLTQATLQEINR